MDGERPRIIDIALQAGVSTATVDRVLNGRPGVRPSTVKKVHDAAAWLAQSGGRPAIRAPVPTSMTVDVVLGGKPGFANEILMHTVRTAARAQGLHFRGQYVERVNIAALHGAIETAVATGSGGIILQPVEHPLVRDAIRDAAAAGVPVVSVLSTLPETPVVGYAGLDNRAAGRAAGAMLSYLCAQKGKIAIIMSNAFYRSHEERESGIRNIVRQRFAEVEVLDSVIAEDNPETCYKATAAILAKHGDLRAICNLGAGNRGVEAALLNAGKAHDIAFVAFNLTPLTRKALLDGTIDAVIHQDMTAIARKALRGILSHRASTGVGSMQVPAEIILSENVRDIELDRHGAPVPRDD